VTWQPLPNNNASANDPKKLNESIRDWAKDFSTQDADAWTILAPKWNDIVGDEIAANTKPHSLRDGLLVIVANDPSWVSHLSYLQSTIAASANEVLGYEAVREVQVRRG
jgi:predicted nucleic acid-binding Zn ribbon protein